MSDRIAVPTNGHGPRLTDADTAPASAMSGEDAVRPATPDTDDGPAAVPTPDLRFAFTPGQIAAGFGIVAALILLVVGRRGRRKSTSRRG